MKNSRAVALEIIGEIRRKAAYANVYTPVAITKSGLEPRDAAKVTDLVYGTIRWRGFLEKAIASFSNTPISKIEPKVFDLLLLGFYELLITEVSPHVVNEWVSLLGSKQNVKGFVNALLRKAAITNFDEMASKLSEGLEEQAALSITTSHPLWIVQKYFELLGDEKAAVALHSNNLPTIPTLVALPGIAGTPKDLVRAALSPYGYRFTKQNLSELVMKSNGALRVQDEGSQLAALTLTVPKPLENEERWLDLCAGPGGKTALLAALGKPKNVSLVANEVHEHRAGLVRKAVSNFGGSVEVTVSDGVDFAKSHPKEFDRVLVDVPCTGLGALRRRPDARWKKTKTDLDELVPLQRLLLDSAILATKTGGMVCYVTCSPLAEETTEVVDWVFSKRKDIKLLDTEKVLKQSVASLDNAKRGSAVQLWPHLHETDAMFIQLIEVTV